MCVCVCVCVCCVCVHVFTLLCRTDEEPSLTYQSSIDHVVLDCGLEGSKFEFRPRYNVQFHNNTQGKGMNLFIPPAMG